MDDEKYLYPVPRGKWVISRLVEGRYVTLHQDNSLFESTDADRVLRVLGIPATSDNLDHYFPHRKGKGRCPTLELMELCNVLDPTNPVARKRRGETGV